MISFKEFTALTLIYFMRLFAAWLVGLLVSIIPSLVIGFAVPDGILKTILASLIGPATVSVFLYITMYRTGYKENNVYIKNPLKTLSLPVITSNILLFMLIAAFNFLTSKAPKAETAYGLIPVFLYLIPYAFVMIFGIIMGSKKREKDRNEIMSNKSNN